MSLDNHRPPLPHTQELLLEVGGIVKSAPSSLVLPPAIQEVERNLARLLSASMTLMARSSFFIEQATPTMSFEQLIEATAELESRNVSLFLDPSVTEEITPRVRHNMSRICHVSVVGRVALHMQRLEVLVHNTKEQRWIVSNLGPSADALFMMGTRILNNLLSWSPESDERAKEALHWESIMLEGSLRTALEELSQTEELSRHGRRYAKATLWAFQVARDALVAVHPAH